MTCRRNLIPVKLVLNHVKKMKIKQWYRYPSNHLCVCVHDQLLSHVWLFGTPQTIAHQGLSWSMDYPGKNPGVGCHFFFQGISPTQGSNACLLHLLHCRWNLYHWATGEALNHLCINKIRAKNLNSFYIVSICSPCC